MMRMRAMVKRREASAQGDGGVRNRPRESSVVERGRRGAPGESFFGLAQGCFIDVGSATIDIVTPGPGLR